MEDEEEFCNQRYNEDIENVYDTKYSCIEKASKESDASIDNV